MKIVIPPSYLIGIFAHFQVVFRWRDSQLQVSETDSDFTKWRSTKWTNLADCCPARFTFNMFKIWHLKGK